MIGAIATMAGKDEAIVMLVSKPFGTPASASSAFAFATSARSPKNLTSEWAQFHSGNDAAEDRRGLAEEAAGDQRLAIEREADRLADLRIVERLLGAVRQKPVVARALEGLGLKIRIGRSRTPSLSAESRWRSSPRPT